MAFKLIGAIEPFEIISSSKTYSGFILDAVAEGVHSQGILVLSNPEAWKYLEKVPKDKKIGIALELSLRRMNKRSSVLTADAIFGEVRYDGGHMIIPISGNNSTKFILVLDRNFTEKYKHFNFGRSCEIVIQY